MHVIHRRGWEIPERQATPEDVFLNRRSFLGAAAGAAVWLLDRSVTATTQNTTAAMPDQTLYAVRTVSAIPPMTKCVTTCRRPSDLRYGMRLAA